MRMTADSQPLTLLLILTLTDQPITKWSPTYTIFYLLFRVAKAGTWKAIGWPAITYAVSKIGVSALTRIQQRHFDADSRPDLVVNHCHPGYVATDMSSHKVSGPELLIFFMFTKLYR